MTRNILLLQEKDWIARNISLLLQNGLLIRNILLLLARNIPLLKAGRAEWLTG